MARPNALTVWTIAAAFVAAITGIAMAQGTTASDYEETDAVYAALAAQPHETIAIGGGTIDLAFADGAPGLDRDRVRRWIRSSATAVSTYFGRFPVAHVGILVIADDGAKVGGGTTFGFGSSAIRIHVGRGADDGVFARDWVLTHEMTHLALPVVPRRSWWLLEGSATYVEPIARVEAGQLPVQKIWADMLTGMPRGQPAEDDRGLDHTPTWGRTYWGGATFCLIADVMIRERTHGRKGLQDAFQAINRKSGGNTARWSVDEVMAAGDAATGTNVLAMLYAKMKDDPSPTDLDALFRKLGVSITDGQLVLDDTALSAATRKAITRR